MRIVEVLRWFLRLHCIVQSLRQTKVSLLSVSAFVSHSYLPTHHNQTTFECQSTPNSWIPARRESDKLTLSMTLMPPDSHKVIAEASQRKNRRQQHALLQLRIRMPALQSRSPRRRLQLLSIQVPVQIIKMVSTTRWSIRAAKRNRRQSRRAG